MKSPKQVHLESDILRMVQGASPERRGRRGGIVKPTWKGTAHRTAEILLHDREIQSLQEYANIVSIKRLGFNDHGPVHMRSVVVNALIMADLLHQAGTKLSLEADEAGSYEDSQVALLCAGMLHDIGMTVGREDHEHASVELALPLLDRVLREVYGEDIERRVVVRSMVIECIVGHMATQRIHSLEAGLILIADGCDMEKGRARIPMMIATESRVGDIHKYSASAIEKVRIEKGAERPIRITIEMKDSVGFYQVEEVLFRKINSSPVKPLIELYAGVIGKKVKCYL
jgi:hypothetical protein